MGLSDGTAAPEPMEWKQRVGQWLGEALAVDRVEIHRISPLDGGAIQENRLLDCRITSKGETREKKFVMRNDAAAGIAESRSRQQEFAVMSAAREAGVWTPEPVGFCSDPAIAGKPFAMMSHVAGTGLGPKVVRDTTLGGDREKLGRDLARQLGRIHDMSLEHPALAFIDTTTSDHAGAEIGRIGDWLHEQGIHRPVLAWGLRWAALQKPVASAQVFLHRDFRTGNYLVNEHGLQAILDWEFAGYGDPMSDIGWFCAECWRFSRPDLEAGGITTRQNFYDAYTGACGRPVDHQRVKYWELLAHLRWATIALQQGQRHLSGEEPSLAMAITSRIVDHLELIVLRMTTPPVWQSVSGSESFVRKPEPLDSKSATAARPGSRHQAMAGNLVRIAKQTLDAKVMAGVDQTARLPGLMVGNALGIIDRELTLAPLCERAGNALLASGGWQNEAILAADIIGGNLDGNEQLYQALHRLGVIRSYIYQPASVSSQEREAAGIGKD